MKLKKYLVDTGILIYALRSDLRAFRLLNRLTQDAPVATAAVCVFELLRGSRGERQAEAVDRLLLRMIVAPLDVGASRHAAAIANSHRGVFGAKETAPDALIAGCAVESGSTLVTLNRRQFEALDYPGLDVLLVSQDAPDWTDRLV